MSDAKRIKKVLRQRVADLAQYLFPNGKQDGPHWCVGDITGAPGKSFKICIAGDKTGLWGDFADSRKHSRNLLNLWMYARNVDFRIALQEAAEWCGQPLNEPNGAAIGSSTPQTPLVRRGASKPPIDWQQCVNAIQDEHLEQLVRWRGYSRETCSWLKERGLIGLYNGHIAFPVHDEAGTVVGAHYRPRHGDGWFYTPGVKVRALVIGELIPGELVHCFESPWDAFAFMDISGERSGGVTTRGACNGALVPGLIAENCICYLWTQNDEAVEQVPNLLSYGYLKLQPLWDPLRGDPRFEKFVASLAPKD
jgi:hypothetical protein